MTLDEVQTRLHAAKLSVDPLLLQSVHALSQSRALLGCVCNVITYVRKNALFLSTLEYADSELIERIAGSDAHEGQQIRQRHASQGGKSGGRSSALADRLGRNDREQNGGGEQQQTLVPVVFELYQ